MLDKLFISVLNMSLVGSYAIVFVLITRLLLKKAPKIFPYALWGIVLFRLLCPFSFESVLSLIPMAKSPISQDIIYSAAPQINTGIAAFDNVINPILPVASNISESINPIQIWLFIGTVVWAIGMATMVIYSVVAYIKLKRSLIGAAPLKANIYLADHISSPFVMGLFKPKIYLPSSLSDSEKDYIIAHEMCHIRRFDHITKIIAFAALTIHWFNPLVWIAFIASGKDMEMSCDEAVMKKMNTDIRTEYSQSLLRFGTAKRMIHATPLAFGEGNTRSRVKNVLNYKKPALWVIVVSAIAVVAIGVGLTANPKKDEQDLSLLNPKNVANVAFQVEEALIALGNEIDYTVDAKMLALFLSDTQWERQQYEILKLAESCEIDVVGTKITIYKSEPDLIMLSNEFGYRYYTSKDAYGRVLKILTPQLVADDSENVGALRDMRPMVMVDSALYLDTGKEEPSNNIVWNGTILSRVEQTKKPTENGQSNFGFVGNRYSLDDNGLILESNKIGIGIRFAPEELTYDQAVASALFSLANKFPMGECVAEGHIILGYDDSNKNETKIYTLTTMSKYGFANGNFVEVSGSAFPAVITLFSDNHVEIEKPLDGSDNTKSIKKMFPKEYHDRVFKYGDTERDNLKQQREKYASEYLAKIGRGAKIGDYSDFDYTSLTDVGISVEVSNNLQVFYKAHNYYPSFIGTSERLENGVRMVYEMSYSKNQSEIRFVKYAYDTNKTVEQFTVDAKTGDIVE